MARNGMIISAVRGMGVVQSEEDILEPGWS
jgi:hypothetical protein